jgi:hypothetical protein
MVHMVAEKTMAFTDGSGDNKETGGEVKNSVICRTCLPEVLLANEYGPTWDKIFACSISRHNCWTLNSRIENWD